jgi:hypothetical protein
MNCPQCNQKLETEHGFRWHMLAKHHIVLPMFCEFCGGKIETEGWGHKTRLYCSKLCQSKASRRRTSRRLQIPPRPQFSALSVDFD